MTTETSEDWIKKYTFRTDHDFFEHHYPYCVKDVATNKTVAADFSSTTKKTLVYNRWLKTPRTIGDIRICILVQMRYDREVEDYQAQHPDLY